jgi:Ras family
VRIVVAAPLNVAVHTTASVSAVKLRTAEIRLERLVLSVSMCHHYASNYAAIVLCTAVATAAAVHTVHYCHTLVHTDTLLHTAPLLLLLLLLLLLSAGQEKFHVITRAYYRGAHGIALIYDVTDADSFKNVNYWMANIQTHASAEPIHKVLLGNKVDLPSAREIPTDSGREVGEEFGVQFFEVSAKDGTGVNDAFHALVTEIVARLECEAAGAGRTVLQTVAVQEQLAAAASGSLARLWQARQGLLLQLAAVAVAVAVLQGACTELAALAKPRRSAVYRDSSAASAECCVCVLCSKSVCF